MGNKTLSKESEHQTFKENDFSQVFFAEYFFTKCSFDLMNIF